MMSNSPLVSYTKISPNKTSPRNAKIDTITIHHMAGNLSVETCGNVFASTSRGASSNYGIGSDGRIGMYVEEADRSWGTGSGANDNRAITIEVANDGGAPDWHVSDPAIKSLINLCADICIRNGIKRLIWKGDKSLVGQPDKQNMTIHQWFQATACPGPYLLSMHSYIAEEVNKILAKNSTVSESNSSSTIYRVQVGAFSVKSNAENMLKKLKDAGFEGFIVTVELDNNAPAPAPAPASKKSVDEIAREVIQGKWGNGTDRKNRLTQAGYNYSEVQARVDALLTK